MIRRDIIMDEIEKLGKVLGLLLARLIGTSTSDSNGNDVEIREIMKEKLDLDLDEFVALEQDQIKPYLKERKFSPSHLSDFSDILLELARRTELENPAQAIRIYEKTLDLYALMDQVSQTISLDRYQKENWINQHLSELKSS